MCSRPHKVAFSRVRLPRHNTASTRRIAYGAIRVPGGCVDIKVHYKPTCPLVGLSAQMIRHVLSRIGRSIRYLKAKDPLGSKSRLVSLNATNNIIWLSTTTTTSDPN